LQSTSRTDGKVGTRYYGLGFKLNNQLGRHEHRAHGTIPATGNQLLTARMSWNTSGLNQHSSKQQFKGAILGGGGWDGQIGWGCLRDFY
ncbi:hypothetical protein ACHAXN_003426, partial [Cyclotella atomus]